MELFEDFGSMVSPAQSYIPKDIRDAYASVLYCCANADKDISDEELVSLANSFINIPVFEDYDEAEYLVLAEQNAANFTPLEILRGSFNYIKQHLRPKLFFYCCDIFLADGVISEEEKQTMEKIAEISGIDEDTVKKIIEVAMIRNVKDE